MLVARSSFLGKKCSLLVAILTLALARCQLLVRRYGLRVWLSGAVGVVEWGVDGAILNSRPMGNPHFWSRGAFPNPSIQGASSLTHSYNIRTTESLFLHKVRGMIRRDY